MPHALRRSRLIVFALLGAWATLALLLWPGRAPRPQAAEPLPPGVKLIPDAEYAKVGRASLKLDVLIPTAPAPRPIAVWIHGGAWRGGDKAANREFPATLVQAGYLTFSINYRLSRQAQFPAQIYDCKAALRWIRLSAAQYGGDPRRLGVVGASAGGHLAALLGTSGGVAGLEGSEGVTGADSGVQAVVDWFGPSDLTALQFNPDFNLTPVVELLGAHPADVPAQAAAASPVTFIDRRDPPFLIIHGAADPVVPVEQSRELRDRLKRAGVEVEYIEVPGGRHGGFRGTHPDDAELFKRMVEFLDKHLQPAG
jgi:acetyl esterase/lipase